jgi:hypothetical protein
MNLFCETASKLLNHHPAKAELTLSPGNMMRMIHLLWIRCELVMAGNGVSAKEGRRVMKY